MFPYQLGGVQGRDVTLGNLQMSLMLDRAAAARTPQAVIFLDLKAAFYRAARATALQQMRDSGLDSGTVDMFQNWHRLCWFGERDGDR